MATANLKNKPSHYRNGNLAATAAHSMDKGWMVRTAQPITITPRFGKTVTLAAGWLICLPVDAERLVRAGLGCHARAAYNRDGKLTPMTIPNR